MMKRLLIRTGIPFPGTIEHMLSKEAADHSLPGMIDREMVKILFFLERDRKPSRWLL